MSRRLLAVLSLLLALCGCSDGKLRISLERPSLPELDPLTDPRLAKFSLRVVQAGQTTDQDAYRGNEAELLVGQVPAGTRFDLRLAAKSATDDMLGLGLVLDVPPIDGESTVVVKFRKPIGFVAGGGHLQALNTAGEASSIELAAIAVDEVSEVAATPDGAWLLALAGNKLTPVRTADHAAMEPASLAATGSCVAVSPDSRSAVVCHDDGAVSVVPLEAIGSPGVQARRVEISGGRPSRAAFGSERSVVWVLLDGLVPQQACPAGASSLVQLDIAEGRELRRVTLDRPVADVAVNPRDGTVLLSLPCEEGGAQVGWLAGDAVETGPVTLGARDLALADRGVVVIGSLTAPVKVQASIFDVSNGGLGGPPQTREYWPSPLVLQFTPESSSAGFFAWISDAQQLRIGDVAVAPDGRRALALFSATYQSNMTFGSCLFAADVDADGYLLLDLASSDAVLLQRYTRLNFRGCSANCLADRNGQSMSNADICAAEIRALMQEGKLLLRPEFVPSSTALLFGGG